VLFLCIGSVVNIEMHRPAAEKSYFMFSIFTKKLHSQNR